MTNVFRWFLAAALLATGSTARAASGVSPELQVQRVLLERALEERVKTALVEVVGTGAVVPVINVRLIVEDVKAGKDEKAKKSGVEYVLPGVPVDQQLTKKDKPQLAEFRRSDRVVSATVFVGKDLDAQSVARAKEIAAQILEINAAAGDSLDLKTFEAAAPSARGPSLLTVAGLVTAAAFVALAAAVIIFLFVFPGRRFGMLMEGLVKTLNATTGLLPDAALGPAGAAAAAAGPGAVARTAIDEDALFGFINEENVQGLVQALTRENEMLITSVLECLPRPLAAKAFSLFTPDKRRDIVLHSRAVKYGNPEAIRSIEKQIRSKLGFSFGGVRRMARIVQRADAGVRAALIEDLAKVDPDLAKHLRDNIVEFEDVLLLDDRSFARLARELSIPSLARFLKVGPEAWVERVAQKLNPELANLLREQVSFTLNVSPEAADEEFSRIVEILERLKAAGLITTIKNAQPASS